MKPTIFFDGGTPPFVNEAMLRQTHEQKEQRIQSIFAALSSALTLLTTLIFGFMSLPIFPLFSFFAFGYVFCAVLGVALLALVSTHRKENDIL